MYEDRTLNITVKGRKTTVNQMRASARKKRNRAKRLEADMIAAKKAGMSVIDYRFRQARKWSALGKKSQKNLLSFLSKTQNYYWH